MAWGRFRYRRRYTSRPSTVPRAKPVEEPAPVGWTVKAVDSKPDWKDIPNADDDEDGNLVPLFDLPGELLDMILGDEALTLRDHLALAATCRLLRSCYYTPLKSPDAKLSPFSLLWAGLIALRPVPQDGERVSKETSKNRKNAVKKIWTGRQSKPKRMKVLRAHKEEEDEEDDEEDDEDEEGSVPREVKSKTKAKGCANLAIRSTQWTQAIKARINKADAKRIYKLSDNQLSNYLAAWAEPVGKRSRSATYLYLERAVESLALRLHGGPLGHEKLIKKRVETAAKAAATRKRNGTTTGGKKRRISTFDYEESEHDEWSDYYTGKYRCKSCDHYDSSWAGFDKYDCPMPAFEDKPAWQDITEAEQLEGGSCRLFDLPGELLDMILGDDALNLRDHLALAATCRLLRSCYYTPVEWLDSNECPHSMLWSGLLALRSMPHFGRRMSPNLSREERNAVARIWTSRRIEPADMVVLFQQYDDEDEDYERCKKRGKKRKSQAKAKTKRQDVSVIRSEEWNCAIKDVSSERIPKTDAKELYKLNDDQLISYLKAVVKRNPHCRMGPSMNLFLESAIESLALRLHGGPLGHKKHVKKCDARATKAAATRERNGTKVGGNKRPRRYSY
ncbi:hypothetical protein JCM10212_006627 [Sporobolomyces blumeae]